MIIIMQTPFKRMLQIKNCLPILNKNKILKRNLSPKTFKVLLITTEEMLMMLLNVNKELIN